jgi:hypothetical protein
MTGVRPSHCRPDIDDDACPSVVAVGSGGRGVGRKKVGDRAPSLSSAPLVAAVY